MAVNVLIVDDSAFFRRRLSEIIQSDSRLNVIGTASNGKEAVQLASQLKPDVITMDIEMPELDGIAAVRQIMRRRPTPILMLSTWTTAGAKITLEALDAGALDFLPKRFEALSAGQTLAHQQLCERIHLLAAHQQMSPALFHPVEKQDLTPAPTPSSLKIIVIGTSTGGPVALQKILARLPADFPLPIVLLQHMPASFTPSFAERLNALCAIQVKEADAGEILLPGTAYLAPGGQQLRIKGRADRLYVDLSPGEAHDTYKPCIDITLKSLAAVCPASSLTLILTGMGSDGCEGAKTLHQQGGIIWSQDQASSTIYGMPMAIAKAGIADKILSLNQISEQLAAIR